MKTVALLLYPDMPAFQFSVPYIIFKDCLEPHLFEVKLVAEKPIVQSGAIRYQADTSLDFLLQADIIIIAGWADLNQPPSSKLTNVLKQAYEKGAYLVGLCYGAYPIAYTGLLNGKKASTHWFGEQDFSQRFPQVLLDTNALYTESERIITSAGTSASLDCCLYLIRKFYGSKIANRVARIMVTAPHREGGQAQFIEQLITPPNKDKHLGNLLEEIQQNLAYSYQIDELAERVHISRRTFTRHFQKMTGQSFTQWLINTRLQRSLELLENSSFSIEQISEQIGFQSAVSFRQHFKEKFKVSPNEWRKRFVGN